MKTAITLLLAFALCACTLSTRYRKPDTPDEQMRQDFADCQNIVARQKNPGAEEIDRCMVERGYFVSS
jgi:hypothetical protein